MEISDFKSILLDDLKELMASSPIKESWGMLLYRLFFMIKTRGDYQIFKGIQSQISDRFKICMYANFSTYNTRFEMETIKWIYLTLLGYPNLLGSKPYLYIKDYNILGTLVLSLFNFEDQSYNNEKLIYSIFKWILIVLSTARVSEIFNEIHEGYLPILKKYRDDLIEASSFNMENRMFLIRFLNEKFDSKEEVFRL